MIVLAANKLIMRSELPNNSFFEFRSHDRKFNLLINIIGQFRPHEQTQLRPHDRKFDLLKKLNFDLMKFDLLTPSR